MTLSSSSESGVTVEIGLAPVGEDVARERGHSEALSSSGRCVIPKVQPAVNMSDQQVPVFGDQTVPVWPSCKPADLAPRKEKSAHTSSGSSYGGCYQTVYHRSSFRNSGNEECYHTEYHRSSPRNRDNEEALRRSGNATEISSKVSFDDIMSMYKSSLM